MHACHTANDRGHPAHGRDALVVLRPFPLAFYHSLDHDDGVPVGVDTMLLVQDDQAVIAVDCEEAKQLRKCTLLPEYARHAVALGTGLEPSDTATEYWHTNTEAYEYMISGQLFSRDVRLEWKRT